MSTATITLIVSLAISVVSHSMTILFNQRPKFVVVANELYFEAHTWRKAKKYIKDNSLDDYQVFILEKNEYTFITSSPSRRMFTREE